ncbi:hypothetical protein G6F42_009567 [Rhizopus arrhizus]|nr:hypothetical protein G6F42_009567 [Rhizopus arrhizus]
MTDNKDAEQTEGLICKMVLEGGYECCNTISQVQELLSAVSDITEKEVAETIGCMARTHTNMTGVGSTTKDSTTWRIDNFVMGINEKSPTLDWTKVFQCLDYEHFFLYDSKGLDVLVTAWRCYYAIEQEEQIWLDNCIHELEQDEEDEDEEMPLSPPPQSENTIDFIQKDIYYQPYPIPYF